MTDAEELLRAVSLDELVGADRVPAGLAGGVRRRYERRRRTRVVSVILVITCGALGAVTIAAQIGRERSHPVSPTGLPVLTSFSPGDRLSPRHLDTGRESPPGVTFAYHLLVPLPDTPLQGRVWQLDVPSREMVNGLARAFGLPAPALAGGNLWIAHDGVNVLTVANAPGGQWQFSPEPGCPANRKFIDRDLKGATYEPRSCESASPSPSTAASEAPAGTAVRSLNADDATVRRSAAPVLAAAGIPSTGIYESVSHGSISVDPFLDGVLTVGAGTTVTVNVDGSIANAAGMFVVPTHPRAYPVIGAAGAFDALNAQSPSASGCPDAAHMSVPVRGAPVDRCSNVYVFDVSDVQFVLSVASRDNTTELIPAWLFDTGDDTSNSPSVIAVDPAYLRRP